MASLVERVDLNAQICNRRQYLQLFLAQRAHRFREFWAQEIGLGTRRIILAECGVPRAKTPVAERFKGFPERFTVEELTTPADIDE